MGYKMKTERRKVGKWDAIIYDNKEGVTITYAGSGGAIISNSSLEVAEKKFIEAMNLFEAFVKLLNYCKSGLLYFGA